MERDLFTEEHEDFRKMVRDFLEKEIVPQYDEWHDMVPREVFTRLGELGIMGVRLPEEFGGGGAEGFLWNAIIGEEAARALVSLGPLRCHMDIVSPYFTRFANDEQRKRWLPGLASGELFSAIAMTEPNTGSDLAGIRTTARRDGDSFIVNGSKTFITSGMRADYLTVAVRTGGPGMGGVSLLVIEGDTPGLSRTALDKMGWRCSDTATLYFEDCRVPVSNLVGRENQGFMAIMLNFNQERLMLAAQAWGSALVCYEDAFEYARSRETFGRPLIRNQVIRHKLVDMRMRIEAVKANLDLVAWRVSQKHMPIAEVCMLKNLACTTLEWVANEAMQIFGGAGYLRGARVERIYRETKVLTIGGGSLEIMKDLAAKQLGM